jgi:hypothetical protein
MHFKVLIFLSSLLFLVGCSAGPDFERDNENDPDGGSFIPNPPSGEHYELDEEGNVTLFWEDNTDFELGYRIYKSLGENESFKLLAELEENSTSYTDKSKLFAFPTRYHIVSYSEESESYAFTVEIDFGDISNFKAEFEKDYDSVNFSWQNEIYFVKVDGFLLSKKTDKESRFEPVEVIPNSVSEYSIPTPQDGFVHEFKLSAFNIYKSDTTLFASKAIPTISTEPKNLKLELISTDSLMINWKSISDFEDSFQLTLIDQSGKETVFLDEGTTSHTFAKQFVVDDELEVRLAGRNNSVLSPIVTKTLDTTLEPPILEQVQHLSDNELVISISDPSHISRDININRRTENSEFQMIGTAKRGNNTFLDNSADPTKTYTYNASTALSVNSDPIHVHYNKSFKQIKRITGAADLNVVAFEVGFPAYRQGSSKILFPSSYDQLEATYYDIPTENIIRKFDLEIFPNKMAFDRDETKIFTTNYQNSTIHVYDFESGAIIDSLNLEYSDIIDFEVINAGKIVATVRSDHYESYLITIDFTAQTIEVIDSFSSDNPQLIIDKTAEKLLLVASQPGPMYSYDHYSITNDGKLNFNKRDIHSFYTTNFSATLDTAIVVGSDDLSLFDINTGEKYWHFEHHSISNHCCSNVQLLPEKLIVLQGQYCTYLIDVTYDENSIIDSHCHKSSRLTAAGIVNMNFGNTQYLLDLRRSHTVGYDDFFDVLSIKEGWKEIFEE